MTILSKRLLSGVSKAYADRYGIRPRRVLPDGSVAGDGRVPAVERLPAVRHAREHALSESIRWGDSHTFFLAPGIISWMIPLVDEQQVVGGLVGGEVVAEDEPEDRQEAITHFTAAGCSSKEATTYVRRLPAWPQAKTQEAADHLFVLFYQFSGWTPMLLRDRHDKADQQRQIAEEIHRRKSNKDATYPLNQERMLLSLIRAGDRKGARKLMNQMLGAIFLRSANLAVVRALMIEMMGYLARTAVEDSPYLEPLLEKNHLWMACIIEASDFEELAKVVRDALDDFMNNIYQMGYRPSNSAVQKALDHIAENYKEPVSLDEVGEAADLSSYRIAHLIKEHTGKSVMRHVHRMRVQEAQRLLEQTTLPCADIAFEVGFGDQSYFTKQFRLLTGTTPAKHRRTYRSQ